MLLYGLWPFQKLGGGGVPAPPFFWGYFNPGSFPKKKHRILTKKTFHVLVPMYKTQKNKIINTNHQIFPNFRSVITFS